MTARRTPLGGSSWGSQRLFLSALEKRFVKSPSVKVSHSSVLPFHSMRRRRQEIALPANPPMIWARSPRSLPEPPPPPPPLVAAAQNGRATNPIATSIPSGM
ncbi:hypothetical protein ABZW30_40970 [Kitasatospora sp. NPDC004669]|uniref:hypothetical protein n=1 Tax=Kitasatospora sp. NPDC004669 TaxID=3154555 RepID=UPI0033BE0A7A